MANQKLSLTRDQFASFLNDFEQIKQFERLFATTDANVISIDDTIISAGNAGESANDALAQIIELAETLNKEPAPANVSQIAVIETQLQAFGITPPASIGSVTSVAASGGSTGLTFSGSPITTSGTLTIGGTLAVASGGTGAATAAIAITNLGATTLGGNMFTLTNPSAITFPRFNADNTVSALDAATFRAAIGAGTGGGSVTSVSGTGTVNGITLTGTVTSSGSLTLGGTLSGVSLTTQVSGTLPIANGGTNGTASPTAGAVPYGTGTAYAFSAVGTSGQVLTSSGAGAPTWTTPTTGTVTSVTGTSPVVSSGGSTPAISMAAATASVNGYLTSTDWTTFNSKGSGTVTSVSGTGTVNGITLTGTITSSGSLTLGGTLGGIANSQLTNSSITINGSAISLGGTVSVGTVTSVTGTAPVVSSGGATPAISMAAATTSVNGYLTSTDWTTFNGKQAALVSGTNIKTVNNTTLLGSGDLGTITAGYGGTGQSTYAVGDILYASAATTLSKLADVATGNALISGGVATAPSWGKIGLTTHISGTLAVGNGGTGATTLTSGYLVKGNGTSAVSASVIYDDGTNAGIGTASPAYYLTLQNPNTGTGGLFRSVVSRIGDQTNFYRLARVYNDNSAATGMFPGFSSGFYYEKSSSFGTSGGLVIGTAATNGPVIIGTGDTERVRVDISGNVGIGATANASAILDVQSTTKGFRLPNMTTVQKNAIASPAAGLMVFDTTLAKACVYSGAAWQTITSI